ncbi:MAG: hypothetical protein US92_C0001G0189 [Candidatus Peregrinibacteria bacterium GW2011_GWA2_38_36]|nr:MAG: hypothetical protein US92_C0001G0189 [Candidatus Peregrinibacteria bacterium GW2011_GWA2_38_36]
MGSKSPTILAGPSSAPRTVTTEPAHNRTDREIIDEIDRLLKDTHDLDALTAVLDEALNLADGISKPRRKKAVIDRLNDPSVIVMKYKAEFDFYIKMAYSDLSCKCAEDLARVDDSMKKASEILERIKTEVETKYLDRKIYETALDELRRLRLKRLETSTQPKDQSPEEKDEAILLRIDRMLSYAPRLETLSRDIDIIRNELVPQISDEDKKGAVLRRIDNPNIVTNICMKEFGFCAESLGSCLKFRDLTRSGYLARKLREIATQLPDESAHAATLAKVEEFEERYAQLKSSIETPSSSSAVNENSAFTRKRITIVLAGIGALMIAIAAAGSHSEKTKQTEDPQNATQPLPPEDPINIPSIKDYLFADTAFRDGELCAIYKTLNPNSDTPEIFIPLRILSKTAIR